MHYFCFFFLPTLHRRQQKASIKTTKKRNVTASVPTRAPLPSQQFSYVERYHFFAAFWTHSITWCVCPLFGGAPFQTCPFFLLALLFVFRPTATFPTKAKKKKEKSHSSSSDLSFIRWSPLHRTGRKREKRGTSTPRGARQHLLSPERRGGRGGRKGCHPSAHSHFINAQKNNVMDAAPL